MMRCATQMRTWKTDRQATIEVSKERPDDHIVDLEVEGDFYLECAISARTLKDPGVFPF